MPFEQEARKGIPTSIGAVEMHVTNTDGTAATASVMAKVLILDETGAPLRWTKLIDIGADLTATQRTQLLNITNAIRTQAGQQVIPPAP